MTRASIALGLIAATLPAAILGCVRTVPVPAIPVPTATTLPPPPTDAVVYLDQGWTPELTRAWYRTPQGSQLVPYRWALALEQVGNDRPFLADEVIERFRYLPEPKGDNNPDGLPV